MSLELEHVKTLTDSLLRVDARRRLDFISDISSLFSDGKGVDDPLLELYNVLKLTKKQSGNLQVGTL